MALPPGLAVRGPRSLLRQIREAMAGAAPAQSKLNQVVRIIARSMVSEVCSIYLRRASGEMELFATEGLDVSAVHVTRMKPGEGLVGEIMRQGRPLALSNAPSHPAFSYRPETGEDPYHAFLGVPLLRGVRLAEGIAYGTVVLHEAPVAPEQLLSDDISREEERLKTAVTALHAQIAEMMEGQRGIVGAPYEVLEAYSMMAQSQSWNHSLEEAVRSGLTAEAAVERVRSEHRASLGQARDPYIRERLHDLEDLNDRLLRHLTGKAHGRRNLPDDAILIARNLGPADLLEYDRTKLKGILLEEGSPASHASIIARAIDIPCVGRLQSLRGP